MAAIPYVFTISHVAKLLREDEDWLHEISVAMDPKEGCLWVFGVGEHGVPAFTEYGIEMPQADHCQPPRWRHGTDAKENRVAPAALTGCLRSSAGGTASVAVARAFSRRHCHCRCKPGRGWCR